MEKIYRVQMNSKGMPNFSTAVEIADRLVRCGECKYWHKNRKEGDGMNVFDVCYDFQADDFCSYGERKESE